jgi:hypothetical protein
MYYKIVIRDLMFDIIFSQTIECDYLDALNHAQKLCDFFSFDCYYELEFE